MAIYTRTGDDGTTGLFGNRRVAKDDARITAYGTIDELNSVIGLVGPAIDANSQRTKVNSVIGLAGPAIDANSQPSHAQLKSIQDALFEIGADLATEGGQACVPRITTAIGQLESWIDASEQQLTPLKTFVLPGGCQVASLLHLARTVTRRAERYYWTLRREVASTHPAPDAIGIYLNRLSDLCFSWARLANKGASVADIPWTRSDSEQSS